MTLREKYVHWHRPNSDEATIVLYVQKGFWFMSRTVEISYRGSCTVWHDSHTGERAPTSHEEILSGFWQVAKWAREDSKLGEKELA